MLESVHEAWYLPSHAHTPWLCGSVCAYHRTTSTSRLRLREQLSHVPMLYPSMSNHCEVEASEDVAISSSTAPTTSTAVLQQCIASSRSPSIRIKSQDRRVLRSSKSRIIPFQACAWKRGTSDFLISTSGCCRLAHRQGTRTFWHLSSMYRADLASIHDLAQMTPCVGDSVVYSDAVFNDHRLQYSPYHSSHLVLRFYSSLLSLLYILSAGPLVLLTLIIR